MDHDGPNMYIKKEAIPLDTFQELMNFFTEQLGVHLHGIDIVKNKTIYQNISKEVIKYITEIKGFSKPKIIIPKWFAYFIAVFFEIFSFILSKDLAITRERIYKFTMPTDYRSEKLENVGYVQKYSVKDRIQNMANWYLRIKKKI